MLFKHLFNQDKYIRFITIALIGYSLLYAILLFFNLDRIPIAWIDEIMGLDPAVNFVYKDGLKSKIWPQAGTENQFMAYLPLRFWVHIANLSLVPFKMFWVRLPWAIMALLSFYFFYKSSIKAGLSVSLGLLLTFILINDKVVFETIRAVRVEPLSFLVLSLVLYAHQSRKLNLQAIASSTLLLIHPNLWFIALVLFFDACLKFNTVGAKWHRIIKPNMLWVFPLSVGVLLLLFIHFDISMFMDQLVEHGNKHSANGSILNRIKHHFYTRFWPTYTTQPWMILILVAAFIHSTYKLFKKSGNAIDLALIGTHIFWMLALAPYYRYNGIIVILSLVSLIPLFKTWRSTENRKLKLITVVVLILAAPIDVMSRHTMAILQRPERNPEPVVAFIKENIKPNSLIFGHDISYYAVGTNPKNDYMLFNLETAKFKYNDYKHVYVLSSHPLQDIELLAEYNSDGIDLPPELSKMIKSETYKNLFLYSINSMEEYNTTLLLLRAKNKTFADQYSETNEE